MVKVKALVASISRVSWKAGNVQGKVEHQIDADGTHRIVVTIPASLAEWEPEHVVAGPTHFREHPSLRWDDIKPPPKVPKK